MSRFLDRLKEVFTPVPEPPPPLPDILPEPLPPVDHQPSRIELEAAMLNAQRQEAMPRLTLALNRIAGSGQQPPARKRWPWGNGG